MVRIANRVYNVSARSMRRYDSIRASSKRSNSTAHDRDADQYPIKVPHDTSVYVRSGLSSGPIDYYRGWAWQQSLLDRRLSFQRLQRLSSESVEGVQTADDNRDQLLVLEHSPVYTLGRGADEENLIFLDNEADGGAASRRKLSRKARGPDSCRLSVDRIVSKSHSESISDEVLRMDPPSTVFAPNGAPIYRIERGGEVTFHGPKQLVVYPLIDLRQEPYERDLHWYLNCIEEIIIQTLKKYDIEGVRDEINTGVWVNQKKIAAVGISCSRWITTHGFALNVDPNLEYFDTSLIVPCGIEGREVTSIAKVLKERGLADQVKVPSVNEVSETVIQCFEETFGVITKSGDSLI